ncbi:hypothetical protein N3K66_002774 [Trichothecium roseum]|uniref:Uncharacterized protein n=1 Tax=Trichothecium roseum TaxID=47278 RepID=A0ACC0VAK6_9HYPO|nr:hypothetical protein N3K66_002774 [Trichothecium roseum]
MSSQSKEPVWLGASSGSDKVSNASFEVKAEYVPRHGRVRIERWHPVLVVRLISLHIPSDDIFERQIVLVRMCADGAKSAGERFAYSNAAHGMYRVWRDEGIATFTRGAAANVARSVLMSELCQPLSCKTKLTLRTDVGQIATYSTAKQYITKTLGRKDDVGTHALASLSAGTVATTICAPADVLKSRIQSATAIGSGRASLFQIIQSSIREEGPRFLMKGWTPAWLRLTPHTVLTFVFMEQLRSLTQLKLTGPNSMTRTSSMESMKVKDV